MCFLFFFFNDTATTEIYTLSLHDALPIETLHVDLAGGGAEPVAQCPRDDTALRERSAQTRDGRLECVRRRRRDILPPQLHEQALGRHDLVGVQHEQGKDSPLARPPKRDAQPAFRNLERTQDRKSTRLNSSHVRISYA